MLDSTPGQTAVVQDFTTSVGCGVDQVKLDIDQLTDQVSHIKVGEGEGAAGSALDYMPYINEVREDMEREVARILERFGVVEANHGYLSEVVQNNHAKVDLIQRSYNDLSNQVTSQQPVSNANEHLETHEPIDTVQTIQTTQIVDNEALEELSKDMNRKFSELENKFEKKADSESTTKQFEEIKAALNILNSHKHVDPNSHASHAKDIVNLNEKTLKVDVLENNLKNLVSKLEMLQKKSDSNEE